MKLAEKQGYVTRGDVMKLLRISPAQAYHLLNQLKAAQKLVLEGRGKAARYRLKK